MIPSFQPSRLQILSPGPSCIIISNSRAIPERDERPGNYLIPMKNLLIRLLDRRKDTSRDHSQDTPVKNSRKPVNLGNDAYILPPKDKSRSGTVRITLFAGKPVFKRGQAVLFDSGEKEQHHVLPRSFRFRKIVCSFKNPSPEYDTMSLTLLIGDMVRPVLFLPLPVIARKNGEHQFEATRKFGAKIRLHLVSPHEKETRTFPELSVIVEGEEV